MLRPCNASRADGRRRDGPRPLRSGPDVSPCGSPHGLNRALRPGVNRSSSPTFVPSEVHVPLFIPAKASESTTAAANGLRNVMSLPAGVQAHGESCTGAADRSKAILIRGRSHDDEQRYGQRPLSVTATSTSSAHCSPAPSSAVWSGTAWTAWNGWDASPHFTGRRCLPKVNRRRSAGDEGTAANPTKDGYA